MNVKKINIKELKSCVDLIQQLVGCLATIECVKNIVIVLCELLDLVWLNQSFRHSDPQVVAANEQLIAQLYQVYSFDSTFINSC